MTVKKIPIYLAEDSLKLLEIIGGKHSSEIDLNISSAVNLSIQVCGLLCEQTKLSINTDQLLFCCDILNGGAQLTEFQTPDSVSILSALESAQFGLIDAAQANYGGELEKWNVDGLELAHKIQFMPVAELFVLAIATRQFWSGVEFASFKNVSNAGEYQKWAAQWCS